LCRFVGFQNLHYASNFFKVYGRYKFQFPTLPSYETVVSDSIDTLTLHGALVGLACFFGYGIQRTLILIEDGIGGVVSEIGFGKNFPLFPLCMLGGILVDRLLRTMKMSTLVDHNCMQRVSGIALDYLVCAAIAMMQLDAISSWPYAMITFGVLNIVG
jgi:glutamate:Na+ symporter, ESS family